jgi:hypothetical protein
LGDNQNHDFQMEIKIPFRQSQILPSTFKQHLDFISNSQKEKIYHLLLASSNKGLKEANWRIGALSFYVCKNSLPLAHAKAYCRKASNKVFLEGKYWLATLFFLSYDYEVSTPIFKVLAEQNQPEGLYWYGASLFFGYAAEKDVEKSKYYFCLASKGKDALWSYYGTKEIKSYSEEELHQIEITKEMSECSLYDCWY